MSVSRFPHALGNTSGLPLLDQNVYRMDKLTPGASVINCW